MKGIDIIYTTIIEYLNEHTQNDKLVYVHKEAVDKIREKNNRNEKRKRIMDIII